MVTKQQIAEAVGVSRASVSQVLNDAPNARISPLLRQRILTTAAELGYRHAKASPKRSFPPVIAYVLVHDQDGLMLQSSWTSSLTASLQAVAQQDHRALLLLTGLADTVSIRGLVERLNLLRPLGVILDGQVPLALIEQVQHLKLPVVVASSPLPTSSPHVTAPDYDLVGVDVTASVHRLLDHLAEIGGQSIGLISNPLDAPFDRTILEAYQSWLKKHGRPVMPERVQVCEQNEAGVELLIRLRALGIKLDSMLCGGMDLARTIAAIFEFDNAFHQADVPRLAVLGNTEQHKGALKRAALCGCSVSDFAQAIYTLLASGINNTGRKPCRVDVPLRFLRAEI